MLLRKIIDSATSVLGRLTANRKIEPQKKFGLSYVKVNLGCGLALAPGWVNVDASLNALFGGAPQSLLGILYRATGANRYYSRETYCDLLANNRFVFHDLGRSLPFPENSVDAFFSSHFFEHLFKRDAHRLMKDCHRALRPGGVIRIAVPDLAYALERYQAGFREEMLENYFFVDDLSSFLARHKYMYDFELLKAALETAGFENIRRCRYQEGTMPDIKLLDNRPEETLFVEATK